MILQINSGNGPKECERACFLYCQELLKEYPKMQILDKRQSDDSCFLSVQLYSEEEILELEGSVQWICKSPFRPHHKRKNWFINVSVLEDIEQENIIKDIQYETIHSSKKGGQNVNKVATAVRSTYIPTGVSVVCMDQRSQMQNKKIAILRLIRKLEEQNKEKQNKIQYRNWNRHNQIVRGNPYRVYEGLQFKRIK